MKRPLATLVASGFASFAAAASVPSVDGVAIHYDAQGQGDPALVFVHCWACDSSFWQDQVPQFSQRHRVVTLDLAGHGRSGHDRKTWSVEAFGEDVAAVVRQLDLHEVVLIGHSMGGPVILEAARRLPGRVVGLVPVDTLLDVERQATRKEIDEFLADFRSDFPVAARRFVREYMFTKDAAPGLVEAVANQAAAMDPAIGVAAIDATWSYDAAAALDALRVPIVAVNADLYPTKLEAARRHAPQFDAVIVEGLGHYLMREDPARFNQALERALEKIGTPAPR